MKNLLWAGWLAEFRSDVGAAISLNQADDGLYGLFGVIRKGLSAFLRSVQAQCGLSPFVGCFAISLASLSRLWAAQLKMKTHFTLCRPRTFT